MPWDRVHDEAEVLEHYISEELERADRREARRPEPRPARRPDPERRARPGRPTTTVVAGRARAGRRRAIFARVSDRDSEMLRYLDERGIRPGCELRSCAAGTRSRGRCSSRSTDREHALGNRLAAAMRVSRSGQWPMRLLEKTEVRTPAPRRRRPRPERRTPRSRRCSPARPRSPAPPARSLDGHAPRLLAPLAVPRARRSSPRSPTSTRATSPPTSPPARSSATCCSGSSSRANLIAMLIQTQSAKLGIATGKNLPELCRETFSRRTSIGLWVQAEVVAMRLRHRRGRRRGARPQPAVRHPALPGGADRRRRRLRDPRPPAAGLPPARGRDRGARRRRPGLRSGSRSSGPKPDAGDVAGHLFVPGFGGTESILLATGIIGATVMPHVVYLHSALTQRRVVGPQRRGERQILRFEKIDVVIAMAIAGVGQPVDDDHGGGALPRRRPDRDRQHRGRLRGPARRRSPTTRRRSSASPCSPRASPRPRSGRCPGRS